MNRKERILHYLREATDHFASSGFSDLERLETSDIARALHLDRTNVSKLLNELWNAGQVVKVQGRPTLYLSCRSMESALPGRFIPLTVAGREELIRLCETGGKREAGPAPAAAGDGDSLRASLGEALPVCAYPPYGLPLLLLSSSQEDAETFVHGIFEQLKEERPAGAQLITVDCRGSLQGDSSFLQKLFGCSREVSSGARGVKSSFELSAHGMVYIEGVQRLPGHILEMLLSAIDRGSYCRLGETAPRPIETTLILSLPPQSDEALLSRLNKHIPYRQELPSLESRGIHEKLTLLLEAFGQEASMIGRPLRLSKDALSYLLTARYPAGISELRGVVKLLCSAVLRQRLGNAEEHLAIECRHLPQRILSDAETQLPKLSRMIRLLSMVPNDYVFFFPNGANEALQLFHNVYLRTGCLDALPDAEIFFPDAEQLSDPGQYIEELLHYLRRCEGARVAQMQKWIPHYILHSAGRRLSQSAAGEALSGEPALQLGLLIPMLYVSLRRQHLPLPAGQLPPPGREEADLCRALFALFCTGDDFALLPEEEAFFAAYLAAARQLARGRQTALLVLCQNDTLADGYAALLRQNGPEGLPVACVALQKGENVASLAERAAEAAEALHRGGGVVVAADMPPLQSVVRTIAERTGIPCRAAGEVSLLSLMSLAEQCASGVALSKISAGAAGEPPGRAAGFPAQMDPFMRRYLEEGFAPDLTFLDAPKAARTLSVALDGILADLKIPYTHEVAIKFLSHSSHMLERVISHSAMNFPNLRRFLAENRAIAAVVQRRLEPVANTFGIAIPAAEIAYVAEIFHQYE